MESVCESLGSGIPTSEETTPNVAGDLGVRYAPSELCSALIEGELDMST